MAAFIEFTKLWNRSQADCVRSLSFVVCFVSAPRVERSLRTTCIQESRKFRVSLVWVRGSSIVFYSNHVSLPLKPDGAAKVDCTQERTIHEFTLTDTKKNNTNRRLITTGLDQKTVSLGRIVCEQTPAPVIADHYRTPSGSDGMPALPVRTQESCVWHPLATLAVL